MAKIIVDGNEVEVPDTYTLLQAAEEAGADVFISKPFSNTELVDTVLRHAGASAQ